jgi:hypothetical protein
MIIFLINQTIYNIIMQRLIRKILKEESLKQNLHDMINREGLFSLVRYVGGVENLKTIFSDNPDILKRIGGANGKVIISYGLNHCPCITLDFDIIDEHWNKWRNNSWADINVKYDESKLTEEEIDFFNAYIIDSFEISGSFEIAHFDCPELEKKRSDNYLTLVEINGISKENASTFYGRMEKDNVQRIIDKLESK